MAQEIPVIDMWAPLVPTREIMAHVADNFPQVQLGYLRIFQKREPDLDAYRAAAPKMARDDAQILAELDAANVSRALVTGFDEASTAGKIFVTNDCVAALAGRHPTRFIPFAGIDIMRGSYALRELEHWVRERGFRGLSLRPFMIGLPAEDRHYYPFYEKCVELEIPLSIHASANWTTSRPSDLGHPRHFDVVACDLPELKLILSHAGYPWVLEACLLAWKHPNVYLELAAHRPKYFLTPGAGWEPLLQYGQTTIQDKVLYGTGAFLLGRSPTELLREFDALPLKATVKEKWLWKNAAALLGLSAEEVTSSLKGGLAAERRA
ncbi:MAG TPA: amidohydrolase family protein [Pseudomonadota bacterium]|nr:amidohydrolase family protein [Pseudomonadota bacterium]